MASVPVVDAAYLRDLERVKREIRALIADKQCAPLLVRLAWHDAGTYCCRTKTGGPNGSIRNPKELAHPANAGLEIAVRLMEPIHELFPRITYADLYQLAGVVGVEMTGGPSVEFWPGRRDSLVSTPDGRLPDGNLGAKHLRDVFYRMGLDDKDIVALSGAHALGRAHKNRSGFEGQWTKNHLRFNNEYFIELLKKDQDPNLLRLPTDSCLLDDSAFRPLVEAYAADEERFLQDFAHSFKKLNELGCELKAPSPAVVAAAGVKGPVTVSGGGAGGGTGLQLAASDSLTMFQAGVGVAVAVGIALIAWSYERKRLLK